MEAATEGAVELIIIIIIVQLIWRFKRLKTHKGSTPARAGQLYLYCTGYLIFEVLIN